MRPLRSFLMRLGGSFSTRRREREMAEEMASHLEMQIAGNLRAGMTPEEARRQALLQAGGIEQAKEACRDRRSLPFLEALLRDLRHTARGLRRSPAFTTVVVTTLALGIGANAAIFTLMDRLMLRLLPVKDPAQLVMFWTTGPHFGNNQGTRSTSYPMYQDFQKRAKVFSHVFCRYYTHVAFSFQGEAERALGEMASGNYFQALGVRPALGRVFSPEEDDRVYKGHPVVVLSYDYWAARFGADPRAVGRKVLVNNHPMTIVGVAAEGFTGVEPGRSSDLWIPIQMKPLMTPGSDNLGNRRAQWVQVFARRKPGVSLNAARASAQAALAGSLRYELETQLSGLPPQARAQFLGRRVRMENAGAGFSELRRAGSTAVIALMAMAGLALLIACFNVASLLVARAGARRREIAMRLALGASQRQLMRQLFVESLALAALGTAAGLLVSQGALHGLARLLPVRFTLRLEPDWRIVAFSAALAVLTALLFGLAPARQAVRIELWSAIKDAAGPGSARLRKALVVAQVAFSFLLLAGAGLFVRTLDNLKRTDPGFRSIERLVTFQIDPARSGYSLDRLKAFTSRVQESLSAAPGVKSAAFAWLPVLSGREADWITVVEGRPRRYDDDTRAYVNVVSPGFWETMGVRLIEGRDFDGRDAGGRFRAAIVNRAYAEAFFPGQSPIGRRIGLNTEPGVAPDIEIVGVVENSLNEGPRQGVRRQVFFPFGQTSFPYGVAFYVRPEERTALAHSSLAQRVRDLDATLPVYEMKTLEAQLNETLGVERLAATVSASFGALATLLAAVGLYGVLALVVVRRTREIGLRMALGARRTEVLWMVLKDAVWLLAAGLAAGVPIAWALSRYVSSQLFGVARTDAATALAAMTILAAAVAAAALLPAWRASAIDPMRALRHE